VSLFRTTNCIHPETFSMFLPVIITFRVSQSLLIKIHSLSNKNLIVLLTILLMKSYRSSMQKKQYLLLKRVDLNISGEFNSRESSNNPTFKVVIMEISDEYYSYMIHIHNRSIAIKRRILSKFTRRRQLFTLCHNIILCHNKLE
jgi:hypothetical protein